MGLMEELIDHWYLGLIIGIFTLVFNRMEVALSALPGSGASVSTLNTSLFIFGILSPVSDLVLLIYIFAWIVGMIEAITSGSGNFGGGLCGGGKTVFFPSSGRTVTFRNK